jgi:predicted RNase H-like nuclease (RuvC/YqgF family)
MITIDKKTKAQLLEAYKNNGIALEGNILKLIDSSDDEVNKTKSTKKAEVVEEHSDEDEVDSESDSSGSEDEAVEKKTKEKKTKESFEELTKKLEALRSDIKDVNKEISELEKQLKSREKVRNDYERQCNAIVKVLSKTHTDEVNKAIKSKPKRKGNVNGGFNKEQPVPEVLAKFLGLDEGASMARPKVMSALNNKFTELKLKDGQNTTLDKATAKALGLGKEGDGKVIKFTEFQSFLKTFYPKKEEKEVDI